MYRGQMKLNSVQCDLNKLAHRIGDVIAKIMLVACIPFAIVVVCWIVINEMGEENG